MKPHYLWIAMAAALAAAQPAAAPMLPTLGNYSAEQNQSVNAWLEIDVEAFERNVQRLQKSLNGQSQICAIMKADAYGNGLDLLMPSVMKLGIPCIGITSNEEARVIRAHGYQGRIARVRAASLDEIKAGLPYHMEELIGDFNQAKAISELAQAEGKTVAVHLALNSGEMDRNGLEVGTDAGKKEALALLKLPHLQWVGIMTHFAQEEVDFVKQALAKFNEQSAWIIEQGQLDRSKLTLYTANSFATIAVPESHLDMVSPGGLLYGDTIDANPPYEPIMSFKSRVASINDYPKGSTVGYDGTFTLSRDSVLANLPFGYSDGYRRAFTNKGHVLIRGHKVPVVGKTSMNTTMVDITDFPDILANDEVVIYGKQGDNEITQAEIEDINGALLADLYTIWGNSNPKFIKPKSAK